MRLTYLSLMLLTFTLLGTEMAGARTPKQQAKQLFRQGNRLFNRGKVEQALDKFRRAKELYPSYKIDLNIASALNELERYTEAAEAYEVFLDRGSELAPRKIVRAARANLETLRGKLGRVRIACPEDGATVKMNLEVLGQTPLNRWFYVNPGAYQLEACKTGFTCHTESVELAAGDAREVVMPLGKKVALPVVQKPAPSPETSTEAVPTVTERRSDDRDWRSTAGWITLGVGGASLITGVIFGALVSSKSSEHEQAVEDGKTYGELEEIADAGKRYQTIELATLIAGGVAAAAGGGLLLWHWLGKRRTGPAESAAIVVPFSAAGAHGLAGFVRF